MQGPAVVRAEVFCIWETCHNTSCLLWPVRAAQRERVGVYQQLFAAVGVVERAEQVLWPLACGGE